MSVGAADREASFTFSSQAAYEDGVSLCHAGSQPLPIVVRHLTAAPCHTCTIQCRFGTVTHARMHAMPVSIRKPCGE
jgi:hypothetical protein